MKKVLSLALALMLCLSAVTAMAQGSIGAENLTSSVISTPTKSAEDLVFNIVTVNMTPEVQTIYDTEMEKLRDSDVEAYFGEVKDADGNVVSLKEMLGADTLKVSEFWPVEASGFEMNCGTAMAKMSFATPYEPGEKVLVLIGLVTVNADGTQTVEWKVFEGVGVEEGIEVNFDEETMIGIQNESALMAIVSK